MISYDYIRGLTDGEGTFTFSPRKISNTKVPAFSIKMHYRDRDLLEAVRDKLGLDSKIYVYETKSYDGHVRAPQAMLIVREIGNLKNIIVPLFYKRLIGNKRIQFDQWINEIGTSPEVPKSYKILHLLYHSGYYDKSNKFSVN